MKIKGILLNCWLVSCMLSSSAAQSAFQLEEATIHSTQQAIFKHQITCEQLVSAYIDRIKKYNLSNEQPAINAITEINRSALIAARALDITYQRTHQLIGPLHCVTVLLKDNIDTVDTTTTAGSFALLGTQPIQDAFLVARLRAAGAIILAKAGMDEFAWGMFGISSRSGRIGNAYQPAENPGGSSGGPAAGVSANFALVGIGTDNSGSIRIPAAFNGLMGLRPSTGLVSQRGIFPMGQLDGVAGPLTRTVQDLATVLDVIAHTDTLDPKTRGVPHIATYAPALKIDGLQGKRIGIIRHVRDLDTFANMPAAMTALMQQTLKNMQTLGATFIDIDLPQFDNHRQLNQSGEIEEVNDYLHSFPAARANFQEICLSNRTRNFGMPQKCLTWMQSIANKESVAYQQALTTFAKNKNYVQKIMQQYHLDALLMPISTQGRATYDAMTVNTWQAPIASNAGLPAIAIRIGEVQHLPVGIELIAKQFAESTLIEMAYAYEQFLPPRPIPSLPTANTALTHLSIAELNNLFTVIGATTYETILKNASPSLSTYEILTPMRAQEIIMQQLSMLPQKQAALK